MYKTVLKSKRAGKLVGTEHVNTVISNYKKERWVQNSRHIGKEDSLSVWYSVEELEEFLQKVKDHGGDGIKMYFGAYGHENAPKELYADRQTIVLVATKEKETANGKLVDKDLYIGSEKDNTILAYNIGKICPPFCTQSEDNGLGITILDKGNEGIVIV